MSVEGRRLHRVAGMTKEALNPGPNRDGEKAAPATVDGWDCPVCSAKRIASKFCPECGSKRPEASVTWDCPSCGAKDISTKFCPECGAKKK